MLNKKQQNIFKKKKKNQRIVSAYREEPLV